MDSAGCLGLACDWDTIWETRPRAIYSHLHHSINHDDFSWDLGCSFPSGLMWLQHMGPTPVVHADTVLGTAHVAVGAEHGQLGRLLVVELPLLRLLTAPLRPPVLEPQRVITVKQCTLITREYPTKSSLEHRSSSAVSRAQPAPLTPGTSDWRSEPPAGQSAVS